MTPYDPKSRFEISVFEEPFRRTAKGRQLMARIYQPKAAAALPVLLDLHGGAWNNKDRFANETMARAVAASGVLVVSIDMTLAPEAPYPASVQDANYGVRWLKWKAPGWRGDPSTLGILGSSTGGHMGELVGMKPRDPKYSAIALAEAPHLDASVAYFAARSPISDPYARYQQAEKMKREEMIRNTKTYWVPWETIHEGNPQEILERKEKSRCRRCSSCRGRSTTTCCLRYRKGSPRPGVPPAASVSWNSSGAASTSGWTSPSR